MKCRTFFLLLFLSGTSVLCSAQDVLDGAMLVNNREIIVNGNIINSITQSSLSDVDVEICGNDEKPFSLCSDESGSFMFTSQPFMKYVIVYKKHGFEDAKAEIIISGEKAVFNIGQILKPHHK